MDKFTRGGRRSSGQSGSSRPSTGRPGANRPGTSPFKPRGAKPNAAKRPPQKSARPATASPGFEPNEQAGQRLQKILAGAGLGSRRACEELITEGRVEIDRKIVKELGVRVDPATQEIRVDGEKVRVARHVYYAVNKPNGMLCTNADPSGRARVTDLVSSDERLFCVGRLDMGSEGLVLLTNDGELANRLMHPRYEVEKTYHVQVAGEPSAEQLEQLRRGIHLAEGTAHAKRVSIKGRQGQSTILEMVLDEGKNREIRRVMARIGHKVMKLKRVALGPLKLGELMSGEVRALRRDEVAALEKTSHGQQAPTATQQKYLEKKLKRPLARQVSEVAATPRKEKPVTGERVIIGGKAEPVPKVLPGRSRQVELLQRQVKHGKAKLRGAARTTKAKFDPANAGKPTGRPLGKPFAGKPTGKVIGKASRRPGPAAR